MSESDPAVTRKLTRSKMHEFFAQIEPCLIGMEACGSGLLGPRAQGDGAQSASDATGLHQALCQAR